MKNYCLNIFFVLIAVSVSSAQQKSSLKPSSRPTNPAQMTDEYVRRLGSVAYLWAWPMMNLHMRKLSFKSVPEPGLNGGTFPIAPINHMTMLTDFLPADEKSMTCINQDMLTGLGIFDLSIEPVAIQVPDFKDHFWIYHLSDQRTDSFGELSSLYKTKPGVYMIVGPDWTGRTPRGITDVIHAPTNLAFFIPQISVNNSDDKDSLQSTLNLISAYPVSNFTGRMQNKDWNKIPKFPAQVTTDSEKKWVDPNSFFSELPEIMSEVPPLKGEEALYANINALLNAAAKNSHIRNVLKQVAQDNEQKLIAPLFEFKNLGVRVGNGWTTVLNAGDFGADYLTRTAVARANIFLNRAPETRYFYQDHDSHGGRLDGGKGYTLTFAKGQVPPVNAFWALTAYDQHHLLHVNSLKRYSLGTKDKNLAYNSDGSLTIHLQNSTPHETLRSNWLPVPKGAFSLYLRAYAPKTDSIGNWTPPPVLEVNTLSRDHFREEEIAQRATTRYHE